MGSMIREATYKPLQGIRIWVKSGEASFAKFLNFAFIFLTVLKYMKL